MDNGASSYRRFLDGDEKAFDEIMLAYFDRLVWFVDRYVQDLSAAEDIAMDAFADLIVHRHRYNFKTSFKTYLFMLGKSRALNYIKRRKRIPMVELEQADIVSADEASPETIFFVDERKRLVMNAMAQLPETMRDAVYLVYFEDLSYQDTAKILGKNKKQIDNLLYRSKQLLREILEKDGEALL